MALDKRLINTCFRRNGSALSVGRGEPIPCREILPSSALRRLICLNVICTHFSNGQEIEKMIENCNFHPTLFTYIAKRDDLEARKTTGSTVLIP